MKSTVMKLLMAQPMVCLALALFGASAGNAEISFAGKPVTFYVGGGVGGGVDAFARAFAPYLSKYLPGTPAITVANMGASGGLQAVQYLYNVASKDGAAFGTTNAGPISEPMMGQIKVNYDLRKFGWVGSLTRGDTVCAVWHESPISSLDDARKNEVAVSATGATSAPTRSALFLNAVLHTKFRPVPGYDGGTSLLAIERREVDGTCTTLGSLRTTRPDWLATGKLRILVQVSMHGDPAYPKVPRVVDLVHGSMERRMLEWFLIPYEFNNPIMLPPGTDPEILAVYRQAFEKAVRDKDYLREAFRLSQSVNPHSGQEVEALVGKLTGTDPEVVQRVIAATDLKLKR